jgi:hypothetical protein
MSENDGRPRTKDPRGSWRCGTEDKTLKRETARLIRHEAKRWLRNPWSARSRRLIGGD